MLDIFIVLTFLQSLLILLGLLAVLIGTYTDIKIREVPDWVSYGLIGSGILLQCVITLLNNEWLTFGISLLWFLGFVGLAYLMFYTGQWGGGDSKLLMGLGIVFATYPAPLRSFFSPDLSIPFPLTLLLNIFVFGAAYGLVCSFILAMKNRAQFSAHFARLKKEHTVLLRIAQSVFIFCALAAAITYFYDLFLFMLLGIILAILPLLFIYLWLFARAVEQSCMLVFLKPDKLTEGDWIAQEVHHKEKYICGPKDLGISNEQIQLLQKYHIPKVLVKQGIPFVPAFLIALIISLLFGNVLVFI